MNRTDFANILNTTTEWESCTQKELIDRTLPINKAIKEIIPDKLFRYRQCNDNNIKAFKQDSVYAVTADKFNDPYDTLLRYDVKSIEQNFKHLCTDHVLLLKNHILSNGFPSFIKNTFPEDILQMIRNKLISAEDITTLMEELNTNREYALTWIASLSSVIEMIVKRSVTLVCFCESVQSVIMWSHYAQEHQGFALEYRPQLLLNSPMKNIAIFPVIYNKERFDASSYYFCLLLKMFGMPIDNPDIFAQFKCVLHKSPEWEYEKEWRLIDASPRNILQIDHSCIPLKPHAIYYGKNISKENKNELHIIAQTKEIQEYDMYIDNASINYEMLYRPLN